LLCPDPRPGFWPWVPACWAQPCLIGGPASERPDSCLAAPRSAFARLVPSRWVLPRPGSPSECGRVSSPTGSPWLNRPDVAPKASLIRPDESDRRAGRAHRPGPRLNGASQVGPYPPPETRASPLLPEAHCPDPPPSREQRVSTPAPERSRGPVEPLFPGQAPPHGLAPGHSRHGASPGDRPSLRPWEVP